MAAWQVGLVVMIAVGTAVILFGALWDRERARRDADRLTSPPSRLIPGYAGATSPAYITDLRPRDKPSLALTETRRAQLSTRLESATPLPVGMATPDFVSDPPTGWAVLDQPVVLVCADRVESMHELLQPLQRLVADHRGLVVAAPNLAAQVQETLIVNHLHRTLRLLVVLAEGELLAELARCCGAVPLTRSDLQAGWVPDDALGSAGTWVSDRTQSWVLSGESSSDG